MAGFTVTSAGVRPKETGVGGQESGRLRGGQGDNLDLESSEGPTIGQFHDLRQGTAAAPDSSLNPVAKISRTLAIPAASVHAIGDANASAFGVHAVGTAANQVQVTTLTAFARNVGTAGGTSLDGNPTSPDAVAMQAFSRIQGSGVGASIPFVSIAHIDTATAKAANSAQLFVYNDSGVDSTVSATAQALARGISIYSYGANKGGIGLEVVGPVGSTGTQFDVGVHFTGQTSSGFSGTLNGGIATAAIQDDSYAVTSIQINGQHTNGIVLNGTNSAVGIALGANAGSVVVGALSPASGSLLDLRAGNATVRNLAQIGNTSNAQTYAMKVVSSEGQLEAGVGHSAILTGMTAGDAYLRPAAGTSPVLHLGGSVSTIKVTSTNQLGFFNATAVGQQAGTGNTHTVTAGATTGVFTNTTFDGSTGSTAYTIGDVVLALKNYGLLAA